MEERLARAMQGDQEAFTALFLQHQQLLYKVASTRLGEAFDVADAVQNTMLLVFRNMKKLKDPSLFSTWMVRILINECNSIYRKKKRTLSWEQKTTEPAAVWAGSQEAVESEMYFFALLQPLNLEERQAVTLFYGCDFSIEQISQATGAKVNTVKTRLSRARVKMRERWKGVDEYG